MNCSPVWGLLIRLHFPVAPKKHKKTLKNTIPPPLHTVYLHFVPLVLNEPPS
jgi:hypothetical protein